MQPKPKVIFFGNERLSSGYHTTAPTLQALLAHGYDVCAVVANHEQARSRKGRSLEVQAVAEAHNIPLLLPNKPAEILEQLQAYEAAIGILVAYGRIVPQSVIDIFPHGIINIHPSLLPLHRGSTPIESVILEGTSETGVSLMQLVKAMDAGPVFKQVRLSLQGTETKQALTDQLLTAGKDALIACLPAILDSSLKPVPQDDSQATYDSLLSSEMSQLDFSKPAIQLEREIRAYAEWPKSRMRLIGKDVVLTAAHVIPGNASDLRPGDLTTLKSEGILMVETADGALCIDQLKPAGKNEMTAAEFLRGYGQSIANA